jgi:hypothetical protein
MRQPTTGCPAVPIRRPGRLPMLLGLGLLGASVGALAETNPWYLGVGQTFAHEDNLYRLADGQSAPPGVSKSDTISSTSLLAGLDQPIGRQQLFGTATLRDNRYRNNDTLDNKGYTIKLGAELSTIHNISGRVEMNAERNLAQFNTDTEAGLRTEKNVQSTLHARGVVRVGLVTRLTALAGVSYQRVSYTADYYNPREYDQTTGRIGMRYHRGGALSYGLGLRYSRGSYPRFLELADGSFQADDYTRQGVDLALAYDDGGPSRLDAELTFGHTRYELATQRDFSGVTGSIEWIWMPGGRLRMSTRLSRDDGQNSYFNENPFYSGYTDFSRITTALRVRADYEVSAKVKWNAQITQAHRSLVRTLPDNPSVPTTATGSDDTTLFGFGLSWTATRNIVVGCDLGHERRSISGDLSLPYHANSIGCYGQLYLR